MDATNNDKEQCMSNKGRQKTGLKKVEKQSNRSVTFSKRKKGLFKKATELSALCGAETAVIIFSEREKLFSCGQPNVDEVIGRYLAEEETEKANDRYHNNYCLTDNINDSESQQRQEYLKSLRRLEKGKKVANKIQNPNNVNNNGGFWWDQSIDNLDEEELEAYKESMEELKQNVMARVELMMNANNAYDTGFNNSEL